MVSERYRCRRSLVVSNLGESLNKFHRTLLDRVKQVSFTIDTSSNVVPAVAIQTNSSCCDFGEAVEPIPEV